MTRFFCFKLFYTLLACFPVFSFFYDYLTINLYLYGFFIFCSVFFFCWIRGRKSIEVKEGVLYVNNYPFYRRFQLVDVDHVTVNGNWVFIQLKSGAVVKVNFFFDPTASIDESVVSKLRTQ